MNERDGTVVVSACGTGRLWEMAISGYNISVQSFEEMDLDEILVEDDIREEENVIKNIRDFSALEKSITRLLLALLITAITF